MYKILGIPPVLVTLLLVATTIYSASAQFPKLTASKSPTNDTILGNTKALSDKAWERAKIIIDRDARLGKPFIEWASSPNDLPQADIPAFPGAEGGGAYSFGGRGGRVFVVKSLNDSGPGTLREACEEGGARIIVFNVAGIIRLTSPIVVRAPYITIAGNTAPGDGVCIAGESIWVNTHDVVIRHMRFRRGETDYNRRDDAIGGNPIGNIILDHVSGSWGLDENMSWYRHMYDPGDGKPQKLPTVNITIQNSIFSEALNTYNHAFGSTIGGINSTFARNLWANNIARNPSIGMYGDFSLINNVIYNWRQRSADGGDHRSMFNVINNYYKPGPTTPKDKPAGYRILKPEGNRAVKDTLFLGRAYVNGNIMDGNARVTNNNWDGGVQVAELPDAGKYVDYIKVNKPFPMAPVTVMSAKEAYDAVLRNSGAVLPKRDAVDIRVINEVQTGKATYKDGIITDIAQVGGYPQYKGTPYRDSDNDGMPDAWETKYGLNPNDAKDAITDINGDGYTNIEKYIYNIEPTKKVNWKDIRNNRDTLIY
ncbi:polysaccharide lyase [Pedobacter sp. SYSU D00535]|uniref:polysaccharide lyase n=1 Tax=Pedobacter sp. SYSU D00535 TaxID=2810308 RepID=UPI001A959363|nr:polysaccharide lyase [Pedobacter sp. SYSU D00535]